MNPAPPTTVPDKGEEVAVSATAQVRHWCPHKDEYDDGTVTAAWEVNGQTLELHSLAEYFRGWSDVTISHEAITAAIAEDLSKTGLRGVTVKGMWRTAGMIVTTKYPAGVA